MQQIIQKVFSTRIKQYIFSQQFAASYTTHNFSFLQNLWLCWSANMFAGRQRLGVPTGWRQHLARCVLLSASHPRFHKGIISSMQTYKADELLYQTKGNITNMCNRLCVHFITRVVFVRFGMWNNSSTLHLTGCTLALKHFTLNTYLVALVQPGSTVLCLLNTEILCHVLQCVDYQYKYA